MIPQEGLYIGKVMHKRVAPFHHRFTYRVFSCLLDIDCLPGLNNRFKWLRYNRRGLLSFRDKDHGPRDGSPLRPWVERIAAGAGVDLSRGKIMLLCFPRLWGYVFNPLSVYYCFDPDYRLAGILYEVKNTFGDQHGYFMPLSAHDRAIEEHGTEKTFYVSPFLPMNAAYRFRGTIPQERMSLSIRQSVAGEATLFAAINGLRRPLSDAAILRAVAANPLMTWKVIAGIHWEALWLFGKGAKFFHRPGAPETEVSYAHTKAIAGSGHGSLGFDADR
jgi:DUF1365 family protein